MHHITYNCMHKCKNIHAGADSKWYQGGGRKEKWISFSTVFIKNTYNYILHRFNRLRKLLVCWKFLYRLSWILYLSKNVHPVCVSIFGGITCRNSVFFIISVDIYLKWNPWNRLILHRIITLFNDRYTGRDIGIQICVFCCVIFLALTCEWREVESFWRKMIQWLGHLYAFVCVCVSVY